MEIYTDRNPSWLKWMTPASFSDADFFRIVIFFVFHSPCHNLSSMGKSLKEYRWNTPWKKPFYLNKQLKRASTNNCLLFSASSYSEMSTALDKSNLKDNFPSDLSKERICIYDKQKNQFMSVFYHLRNSLAHCRLNMVDMNGECIFILEDASPSPKSNRLKVSARMVIKKNTLLKWIDIIEGGETEFSPK